MSHTSDHILSLPVRRLSLEALFAMVDLRMANPWGVGVITLDDVREAVDSKAELCDEPYEWQPDDWDKQWTRKEHIERIAGMLIGHTNQTMDPVLLDMGEDGRDPGWPIIDGHHRIIAAWMRGEDHVLARIDGCDGNIRKCFGDLALIVEPETPKVRSRSVR
jgi:hypothetical protein